MSDWRDPEEEPEQKRSYDYCTKTVLLACKNPKRMWDIDYIFTTGYKDWDGDEMVWSINHPNRKDLVIKKWKYIEPPQKPE